MGTTPGSAEQRFPGFDVLAQAHTWDRVTTRVVLSRLGPVQPVEFFSSEEEPTARALVDRLLGQDDDPKIPVLEMIDQRLLERRGDGYRYEDMPEDWDAWRRSVAALDADARATYGQPFWDVTATAQMQIIEEVRKLEGDWHGMPAARVFSLWLRYACSAFYSHPWAFNEIGFGGPAYPRGYKNLGLNRRENWEVAERDAEDPVPWAERTEDVRRRHTEALAGSFSGEDTDEPRTHDVGHPTSRGSEAPKDDDSA
jgi:hypothetical protein